VVLGEIRRHPIGDELCLAAFQRLLVGTGDVIAAHHHILDPALREILLEAAVGDRFNLLMLGPPALEYQQQKERCDEIPDVELCLLFQTRVSKRLGTSRSA
jgi:hypothetical protein